MPSSLGERVLVGLAVAIVLSNVARIVSQHRDQSQLAGARAEATQARAAAAAAIAHGDSLSTRAAADRAAAARALASRDSAVLVAKVLDAQANSLEADYHTAAKAAPDTCKVVVARADSALAKRDSAYAAQSLAMAHADTAAQDALRAADSLRVAYSGVRASTVNLATKTAILVDVSRPSLLSRIANLSPKPGVGIAFGVDPTGVPRLITGITLGWSF